MRKVKKMLLLATIALLLCACGKSQNPAEQTEQEEAGQELADQMEQVTLVNLRGDEIMVYLLEDGRCVDEEGGVYIYDGIDTWTDESGVEWNKIA